MNANNEFNRLNSLPKLGEKERRLHELFDSGKFSIRVRKFSHSSVDGAIFEYTEVMSKPKVLANKDNFHFVSDKGKTICFYYEASDSDSTKKIKSPTDVFLDHFS